MWFELSRGELFQWILCLRHEILEVNGGFFGSSITFLEQDRVLLRSPTEGVLGEPSKFGKMSLEEKREFVYQISKWPRGASDILQSWSRQEILQILCAEMGKERKYTGLTKLKMVEHLLKIVSGKKSGESVATQEPEDQSEQRLSKRQRKAENPSRLPVSTSSSVPMVGSETDPDKATYCKNTACKATLSREDAFCKRCSCCICYRYDDNKDPSLWLICNSEPPFEGDSCGMSCHLECALKHQNSCIMKDGEPARNDGSFICVSCGKANDMLRCWRKQLLMGKDTRRVDILCYRLALVKKLTGGTLKYSKLYEMVEEAVKMLEAEVGPLTGVPVKMSRGIVNRLSSGPAIQKLCASAVEFLDSMISSSSTAPSFVSIAQDSTLISPDMVRFDDVTATSITVILGSADTPAATSVRYNLWHRRADEADYPLQATCTLFSTNARFNFSGLTPSTEYFFRVVSFDGTRELCKFEVRSSTSFLVDEVSNHLVAEERSQSPVTNCSSLSNPSSVEDETNNITPSSVADDNQNDKIIEQQTLTDTIALLDEGRGTRTIGSGPDPGDILKLDNKGMPEDQITEEMSMDDGSGKECVPVVGTSEASLPITPCRLENSKDGSGWVFRTKPNIKDVENWIGKRAREEPQDGSTSKKRSLVRKDEEFAANGNEDRDFEFYVKLIRWLECEGHIEKNFRQKFLTWFSLRATPQEVRIVKVFVDIFIEDLASLAEQLVDTFSDSISSKKSSVVPSGICMKLWH